MTVKEVIGTWKKIDRRPAIKEYCKECAGGSANEVTLCPMTRCPLWGWRFGGLVTSSDSIKRMEDMKRRNPKDFDSAFEHLGGAK